MDFLSKMIQGNRMVASLTLLSKAKCGMHLKTVTPTMLAVTRRRCTPANQATRSAKGNMEIVVLAAAFLLSASAVFGEYIYVDDPMGWLSAQRYCRDHYVDLAPVMSHKIGHRLLHGEIEGELWTGLYRDGTQWMWSGGSRATLHLPWAKGQVDTMGGCGSGCWWQCEEDGTGLHNVHCGQHLPFLCYNLIVPQHTGTWEQALAACRRNHTVLSSLQTKTQHLHALSKVQRGLSQRVWIGLRFLADRWMWIDGRRFGLQAWSGEHHHCPALNRCGTLTKEGQWESWDCLDKLPFLCQ